MEPVHVLVPLDGSPLSEDALTYALSVFECQITVLNVVTPLDAGMSEGGVLDPGDERGASARQHADRLIERAANRAAAEGRPVETAVESGDPAEAILSYADQHGVDHIVIGGHGGDPNGLARRLLGTVATTVVAEAPITVTVVREHADGGDH
ncbi:universal stress protein [Natronomonas sp. LN261]|jgi:nucleotide-binding universal stress UspA family protein|uniref:universal stress protein n=1 Tax=Natronomonas sp. LN261 TaxID=2750669 RepID=UPI0015EE7228|nr:universal stress protein [Natronomonas sp. LN261]